MTMRRKDEIKRGDIILWFQLSLFNQEISIQEASKRNYSTQKNARTQNLVTVDVPQTLRLILLT